jgi:hypothetical protein
LIFPFRRRASRVVKFVVPFSGDFFDVSLCSPRRRASAVCVRSKTTAVYVERSPLSPSDEKDGDARTSQTKIGFILPENLFFARANVFFSAKKKFFPS